MLTDLLTTPVDDSAGTAGIQAGIAAVNSDLATLKNLEVAPAVDTSGVLAAGNKAISNAQAAIQWANQQASSIDGQAHQLGYHGAELG